jgi:hypothetical protein
MPSPSATGAVTVLSAVTADMIETVKAALTAAAEEAAPFTAEGLAPYWPALPLDEFAAAFCARTKSAPPIAATFRRTKAPVMGAALVRQWEWFGREFKVPEEAPRPADEVATRLVDDFVSTASAVWSRMQREVSVAHWQSKVDDDGRVTYGTTASGRRARSTVEALVTKDMDFAYDAARATSRTVDFVTSGPYQRAARVARLKVGATQRQVEHAAGVSGCGYAAWENTSRFDAGDRPWWWPRVAAVLDLPLEVDLGPVVPVVHAPWVGRPGAGY